MTSIIIIYYSLSNEGQNLFSKQQEQDCRKPTWKNQDSKNNTWGENGELIKIFDFDCAKL